MGEIDGRFSMEGAQLVPSEKLEKHPIENQAVVYEVIRIIDRVPLFLEDHYERLLESMKTAGFASNLSQEELFSRIIKVVEANDRKNCNVRVSVYQKGNESCWRLHISKSYYPSGEEVEQGVKTDLIEWERNSPNLKLDNREYVERTRKAIAEKGVFEVLLVNADGKITEGSKSNVFFVRGNNVYTAPSEYVLKGVTRKYVIDACKKLDIEVVETLIGVNRLAEFDGVFLSGTSIKVLPVSHIGELGFESASNPTIVSIRDFFDRMVENYVKQHLTSD